MFSLPSAGPAQQDCHSSKKRNRVMCRRCRHDKQGCHPPGRNWENGEKCDRCDRLGYDCSAPERAPVKPRKRRSTLSSTVIHIPRPVFSLPHQVDAAGPHESTASPADHPSVRHQRPRPLSAFGAEAESHLPESSLLANTQSEFDSTVTSTRKSGEQEARTMLATLGDLNATRVLFLSDLALCDQVETWLGPSAGVRKVRGALTAAINAIESKFVACWNNAKAYAPKDIGPKEAFLSQLRLLKHRFCLPSQPVNTCEADNMRLLEQLDDDDVLDMLHDLHKRKKIGSAADYLFGNVARKTTSRHPIHKSSEHDVAMCYTAASEGINRVIASMILEDADHRDLLTKFPANPSQAHESISAFPPCNLAITQASSPSVMFDLWKQSTLAPWNVDCLQRTPVHTAMYVGNIQCLSQIFETDSSTATITGHDAFGMTPMSIAACQDDIVSFIRLAQAGAQIDELTTPNIIDGHGLGMSILALAARNGSERVVRYILKRPQIGAISFTPESAELCQALENGHTRIAQMLIDRHCPSEGYDISDQIYAAKQIADLNGFDDISELLANIPPIQASLYQATESIDSMAYKDYINPEEVLWSFGSSQDFSPFDSDGYILSSQDTNESFSYPDMQTSFHHTPVPPSVARSAMTPHICGRHCRCRASSRKEPP